ncbi:unnamed protein product, partial [Schistosoma mattheei]
MVVGGSQQDTMDPDFALFDTRQQGVSVFLWEMVLPDGFDSVSPSFKVTARNPGPGFPIDYLQTLTYLLTPGTPREGAYTTHQHSPSNNV